MQAVRSHGLLGAGYGAVLLLLSAVLGTQSGILGITAFCIASAPLSAFAVLVLPMFAAPVWWALVFWLGASGGRDRRQYFVVGMLLHYVLVCTIAWWASDRLASVRPLTASLLLCLFTWGLVYAAGQWYIWRRWATH